jgi:hypothetical protein
MKTFLMAIFCLLFRFGSTAQITPRIGVTGVTATAEYATVDLFDGIGFTGQSKKLKADTAYRLSDFNDITSSIRVPAGLVAVVYEHVDNGGGYGISVDLMEDCPDLSRYNFNNITSYVIILNSVKSITPRNHDGTTGKPTYFYYARGRITNGEYVPGTWERERADGHMPENTSMAVVSPPIAPHDLSVLAVNGPTTTIAFLGVQSSEGKELWDKAMNDQLGIIGNDFRGPEHIGTACFERTIDTKSECYTSLPGDAKDALVKYLVTPTAYFVDLFGSGISSMNFWYPQYRRSVRPSDHPEFYKRTLSGILNNAHFADEPCLYLDEDLNLDIIPNKGYEYLISEAHPVTKTGKSILGREDCNPFTSVEAEITLEPAIKETFLNNYLKSRINQNICVYGSWIYDDGHCDQPEIHPAEQIWWMNQQGNVKKYNLNVICDASGRFMWKRQMDDGIKLKPWGAPPVKGLFAIAFEYTFPLARFSTTKKFEADYIDHYNLIEYPNAEQIYNLVYQDKTIVSFIPHNSAFKVSFEHVGAVSGSLNKIRGFVVIETSVGLVTQIATSISVANGGIQQIINLPANSISEQAPEQYENKFFKKEMGHYFFNVTETTVSVIDTHFDHGIQIERIDMKKKKQEK